MRSSRPSRSVVARLRQIRYAWRVLLYDAHNHLQDEQLAPHLAEVMSAIGRAGVVRMVVNGSCEEDWPAVLALAKQYPQVVPSFGYHPWYVKERSAEWKQILTRHLEQIPSAVGEIGLDRWIEDHDTPGQEEVFTWQMQLAAERDLPVSIHCLKAWGRLLELLQTGPRPRRGFLLHSYGGPREMIGPLAKLGAYFSFPGYFAHERKLRQRETFRHVPPDRLLIETDAPDQLLPDNLNAFPLADREGRRRGRGENSPKRTSPIEPLNWVVPPLPSLSPAPSGGEGEVHGEGRAVLPPLPSPLNHPANLTVVYEFLARWLNEPVEDLAARVEENFLRLFGDLGKKERGVLSPQ